VYPLGAMGEIVDKKANIAIGIGSILLLVNIGLAVTGFVDGQIQSGVNEQVLQGNDGLDESGNQNYSIDYDDDWLVSTSERTYFANSITNLEDVLDGNDPIHEMMGPFIYEVTTTREILDFDYDLQTITYSEYDVFEWCENCTWINEQDEPINSVSGNTNITQVNILWNTQRIGGMNTGIEFGEIFAKGMFTMEMIRFDLENRIPSSQAGVSLDELMRSQGGGKFGTGDAEKMILATHFSEQFGDLYDEDSFSNFDSFSAITENRTGIDLSDLDYNSVLKPAIYNKKDSNGVCIAITCELGPFFFSNMGEPNSIVTGQRADLYGYSGDYEEYLDWILYDLAKSEFLSFDGGIEITNQTEGLSDRYAQLIGRPIDEDKLMNLFFNESIGLLTTFDVSGIAIPGLVLGLLIPLQSGSLISPMENYSLSFPDVLVLAQYVEGWVGTEILTSPAYEFEGVLVGQANDLSADDWWHQAFGGKDPLTGNYIDIGLNIGDYAGMSNLNAQEANYILNDPQIGIKSSFAASFMYGEFSGYSLPDDEGNQDIWDDEKVSNLYGITIDEAKALRGWMTDFYYEIVMPALLTFQSGGTTAYTTQPVNNWLYGWSDAVNEAFNRFPWVKLETNDTYFGSGGISTGDRSVYVVSTGGDNVGQQLAQGYINSDGDGYCDFKLDENNTLAEMINEDLDGDGLLGDNEDLDGDGILDIDNETAGLYACAPGEIYGITEFLPWRAPHKEAATMNLLSNHVGNTLTSLEGTVGSYVENPDESFDLNLIGYAIAKSEVVGDTTYKNIDMIQHRINLDPASNQIQGKLTSTGTFVDAIPGALPVYLGADLDLKVEPISTAIMYGDVEVTFYLDTRGAGAMNPDFTNGEDVIPVFEIHTFTEISDDQASDFRDAVTDNLGPMGWSNFGGSVGGSLTLISIVTLVFYVLGIGSMLYGVILKRNGQSKDDIVIDEVSTSESE